MMNKPQYFISDELSEERCYTLEGIRVLMQDEGYKTLTVYPAKIEYGMPYFFCSFYGEIGGVGEGCGKLCDEYKPRNGKNGRCRHSKNCYEPDYNNPKILTINQQSNES